MVWPIFPWQAYSSLRNSSIQISFQNSFSNRNNPELFYSTTFHPEFPESDPSKIPHARLWDLRLYGFEEVYPNESFPNRMEERQDRLRNEL
ncbi:hypothetical protein LEP1GSC188_1807 [Leptospira weilii serovar Topaz str. LT2116]|uniref:Uncharacterized protein n=1 Tax=Leptospira weilii serovar Topaz str. LT2116 TaxID=1088540 RepID=M3EFE8_9LEPT|nr:hypothetical protein LEP1GSC188_1807 [Leptospira weilii serovar Topaz str. LT2116]